MGDSRAALRLGLAPVLLLGWNMASGDALPFLAPSLLVTVLAASPARPKLGKLAAAFVLVVGLTWALSRLFLALADHLALVWLVLFTLAAAAFARLQRWPGDMPAILTLISASVVVVLRQWAAGLGLALPWLMGNAVAQVIVTALLAHAVLPSPPTSTVAPKPPTAPGPADPLAAFGRSAGLIAALAVAVGLEDNSAILVALTAVNILAAPAEAAAHAQGRALLLANLAAAAMTLPLLIVAGAVPDPAIILPLALAGALWLARGIDGDGTPRIVAQAGLPAYVVLLGVLLPKAGDSALPLLVDRVLTVGVVMPYALAVLILLRPRRAGSPRVRLKIPTPAR